MALLLSKIFMSICSGGYHRNGSYGYIKSMKFCGLLFLSLQKGVREDFIRMSLEMNGVEANLAASLINRTKQEGLLKIGKTFADNSKSYIYTIK